MDADVVSPLMKAADIIVFLLAGTPGKGTEVKDARFSPFTRGEKKVPTG